VYLSNNSSFAGPEETLVPQTGLNQDTSPDTATGPLPGLQKTRSCENLLMSSSDEVSSLSRGKSDPNLAAAMDHCDQKLLKDAIGGDTSCSSESVKSSENDRSLTDTCDLPVNGENGHLNDNTGELAQNGGDTCDSCDTRDNKLESAGSEVHNGTFQNGYEGNDHVESLTTEKEVESSDSTESSSVTEESEGLENTGELNGYTNGVENGHGNPNNIGNGFHEMNGHTNGNMENGTHSPDSVNDSSENSIETISETEDNDNQLNGAENYSNGLEEYTTNLSSSKPIHKIHNADRALALKIKQRQMNGDRIAPSLESSTDTVTEDLQNGDSSHTLTPSGSGHTNRVASLQSLCDTVATNRLKSLENTTSISTSTSDLTDSRVHERLQATGLHCEGLLCKGEAGCFGLKLPVMMSRSSSGGVSGGRGQGEVATTSSNTSTCPNTPATSESRVRIIEHLVPVLCFI